MEHLIRNIPSVLYVMVASPRAPSADWPVAMESAASAVYAIASDLQTYKTVKERRKRRGSKEVGAVHTSHLFFQHTYSSPLHIAVLCLTVCERLPVITNITPRGEKGEKKTLQPRRHNPRPLFVSSCPLSFLLPCPRSCRLCTHPITCSSALKRPSCPTEKKRRRAGVTAHVSRTRPAPSPPS